MATATAQANPNIAFIKYWGNRDNNFREALAFTKAVRQLPHLSLADELVIAASRKSKLFKKAQGIAKYQQPHS